MVVELTRLEEVIKYDQHTGQFERIEKGRGYGVVPINQLTISIDGRKYYKNILAWYIVHRYYPENAVLYVSSDKTDNSIKNLYLDKHSSTNKTRKASGETRVTGDNSKFRKCTGVCGEWKLEDSSNYQFRNDTNSYRAECKECLKKRKKEYTTSIRGMYTSKNAKLMSSYGITVEDYDSMLASQDGKCAICSTEDPGYGNKINVKYFAVDHNHNTGAVRGLLCSNCNRGIGLLQDDITLVSKAADYLKEHDGK